MLEAKVPRNHSPRRRKKRTDAELNRDLQALLGPGPMRFGPVVQERSIQKALLSMRGSSTAKRIEAYADLKAQWQIQGQKKAFTDQQMLRLLQFCKYDSDRAFTLMKRINLNHFQLNAFSLEEQLKTNTLFPLPEIETLEGSPVFYMRPARYFPRNTPTTAIIDSLIYVMDSYATKDPENKRGIGFIANMNDWTMANYSTDYCFRFMQVLQGRVFCAKVNLFLIVNPPRWFGKVWAMMKPMLSTRFQKKVHMITEDELAYFLKEGYEKHLPDEFVEGQASATAIVGDFIAYRQAMECECELVKESTRYWSRLLPKNRNEEKDTGKIAQKPSAFFRGWVTGRNSAPGRCKDISIQADATSVEKSGRYAKRAILEWNCEFVKSNLRSIVPKS